MSQKHSATPPQDLHSEQAILGSILIDHKSLIKIADFLKPEHFYSQKNEIVYSACLELYAEHSPIDLTTLSSLLDNKGKLDSIGGRSYLSEIIEMVPTSSHIFKYADIVKTKATLRKMIEVGESIKALGYEEDRELKESLSNAEKEVIQISQDYVKDNFVHIKEILHSTHDVIVDIHDRVERGETVTRGVSTGFFDLDKKLSGLQPADLVIIAARPSMGKTALMLNIAEHIALREKKAVGIFSLEMSKDQLVERMLSSLMGIDSWKLRTGKLTNEDFGAMAEVMDKLSTSRIFIDDSADSNMLEIRTRCRRLQAEHGLDILFVDYLQLLKVSNSVAFAGNRVLEISEISRSLKIIARELNIPVVALSQLSRAVESRPDKHPQLSDLRDSGSIEQDADVVAFLYRDDYYYPETSERPGIIEIVISKHRNGPTGKVELAFKKEQQKFVSIEGGRSDEG